MATKASAQEVLRLHHFNSPRSAGQTKFLEPWAEAVEKASNGTLEIQIFPSMQLGGKQRDLFAQVRDGVVDMAYSATGFTPGEIPALEIFELPFVSTTNSATSPAVQEFYETYLKDQPSAGYRPLIFHTSVSAALHTTKAVRLPADLQGLRLRAPNRTVSQLLTDAGAGVVNVAVPELTESISRGLIDGTPMAFAIANVLRMQEVTEFHTILPLTTVVFVLTINQDTYDNLPEEARAAIDANSGMEWARKLGKIWDDDEKPARAKMEGDGQEIIEPDSAAIAQFEALAEPVIDRWIEESSLDIGDTRALYDASVALVEKYGRE